MVKGKNPTKWKLILLTSIVIILQTLLSLLLFIVVFAVQYFFFERNLLQILSTLNMSNLASKYSRRSHVCDCWLLNNVYTEFVGMLVIHLRTT
jgi:hypothetical protein